MKCYSLPAAPDADSNTSGFVKAARQLGIIVEVMLVFMLKQQLTHCWQCCNSVRNERRQNEVDGPAVSRCRKVDVTVVSQHWGAAAARHGAATHPPISGS